MRFGRDFFSSINIIKRNKKLKKQYKDVKKIVKDGDVDKINDIIKN
jgi:hypothetical protein